VEEHIPGVPGDIFIKQYLNDTLTNKIRFAKEFVKFNERCFVRLLGDMRSYNFVVDITPDVEDFQYRIRAIDFDQQSYEGKKNLYLPQFFKENLPLVELTLKYLNKYSIEQYQTEERTLMAFRLSTSRYRLKEILDIMVKDTISSPEKIGQLVSEMKTLYPLNKHFDQCNTMGQVVKEMLKQVLRKNLLMIPKIHSKFED
jgi:hypothetical protein